MYEYFHGKIAEVTPTQVTIDISGIGYILNISLQTYSQVSDKESAKLYAHLYGLRDDLPVLYGFATKQERAVFRQLIEVSGVGGNTARTILSTFTATELSHIIATGDSTTLKRVKGLGQKTSEKVIVELRDKILDIVHSEEDPSQPSTYSGVDMSVAIEAINALQMLGFNRAASEKVVRGIVSENPDAKIEKIIKLSLKKM